MFSVDEGKSILAVGAGRVDADGNSARGMMDPP